MQSSRLLDLAAVITKSTAVIHNFLQERDQSFPSFEVDSPQSLPKELSEAQDVVIDATAELHDVLLEPLDLLYHHSGYNNSVCLQAITRFGIAKSFPPDERRSYTQLAKSTGLGEQTVRRLLRHAMTMRIFSEPEKGVVAHTAASRLLTEPHIHCWQETGCEEMWPTATRVVDALVKWPNSQEPNETAFSLANNTPESIYQVIGSDPVRAARFAQAMKAYTSSQGHEVSHVINSYDWAAIGAGLVVDIGGGRGHVAVPLAQRYKSLRITIQDMPQVVEGASREIPEELKSRVGFMPHDFFAEQPVKAAVYYFRWVFHNWSDKYSIRILRCLIPALEDGARILINDTCLPEPGQMAQWREKALRSADLNMLGIANARERGLDEWKSLFQEADARFAFIGVTEPKGSALAIIEARWNGTSEVERP